MVLQLLLLMLLLLVQMMLLLLMKMIAVGVIIVVVGTGVVVVVVTITIMHPMEPDLVLDLFALLLRHPAELDRVPRHPQGHALLQPTILAPVPVHPVHDAILLPGTLVGGNSRLASPEETLATLAGYNPVVDARRLVAAHLAGDNFNLS